MNESSFTGSTRFQHKLFFLYWDIWQVHRPKAEEIAEEVLPLTRPPAKRMQKDLLHAIKQLNDILPINNALLKSRSTTATIRCVHRASQWSGCTTFTTRSTMSCGGPM